jgi:glutathione S-transferase
MTTTARPARPIQLHRFRLSGHCHRAELLLSLLDLPYRAIDVDLRAGAHRSEAFLALNVFGEVPVIDDDGVVVADSNAILVYLATRYDDGRWLPRAAAPAAQVQRWLSVAAGPLAFGPAAARLAALFGVKLDVAAATVRAQALFQTMDRVLGGRPFLTGEAPTIADVAIYAYVARAPEGAISLDPYPGIRAWLGRIEALPRFLPMPAA